jgi:hypothetical protein
MGDSAAEGLSSYHAAKATVDAGRIKEPMKRLSAVRAALKSHRVTVSLEGDRVRVHRPDTGTTFYVGSEKENQADNPFWPFSSHSRTVIYHIGSGDEYKLAGTHKGLNIYKEPTGGFAVPKLDADSRFDTKKDAERFIDSWKKVRPNPDWPPQQFAGKPWGVVGKVGGVHSGHSTKAEAQAEADDANKESLKYGKRARLNYKPVKLDADGIPLAWKARWKKQNPGPFHEAGKLVSKGYQAAHGPMDQFLDTAGKVGGYLDSRIGRVLNPGKKSFRFPAPITGGYFTVKIRKVHPDGTVDMQYSEGGIGADFSVTPNNSIGGHSISPYVRTRAIEVAGFARRRKNPEVPSDSSVMLTSNEAGSQLFLTGGDQSLNLSDLGIEGKAAEKEHIVIGDVTHIVYRTRKDFDKMEQTDYIHKLSEDSDGPLPELVYDRINQRMSLVGGVYFIKKPLAGTSPGLED